jgi:hypothetical protein
MLHRGRRLQRGSEKQQQKGRSRLREKLPKRRSTDMNALLMGAQIMLSREEFALSMGQRENTNDAGLKDAQILL